MFTYPSFGKASGKETQINKYYGGSRWHGLCRQDGQLSDAPSGSITSLSTKHFTSFSSFNVSREAAPKGLYFIDEETEV